MQLIIACDSRVAPEVAYRCQLMAQELANVQRDIVLYAQLDAETLDDLRAWLLLKTRGRGLNGVEPQLTSDHPEELPIVWRHDGKLDWQAMLRVSGGLAIFGGPPQRNPERPLLAPDPDGDVMVLNQTIMELRRAIFETTGLYSEPAPPCWLAVTCNSRRMAAWMCAAIILENVDARCEAEVLYVPASADFELTDEVRSVASVVAKAHHYWRSHVQQSGLQMGAAAEV